MKTLLAILLCCLCVTARAQRISALIPTNAVAETNFLAIVVTPLATNGTRSITVGNLFSNRTVFASAMVISGAGNGNTNYTLLIGGTNSPKMYLGSSNVSVTAIMGGLSNVVANWTATITNLSAINWGIGFSSATNRWRFWSSMYGTNAPSVLTNGTALVLQGESEGTNTTVRFNYFAPGF